MHRKILKREVLFTVFILLFFSSTVFAGNIDPDSQGSHYAYSENMGWINFKPSYDPGVTVEDYAVNGYAWGENVGWINLSHIYGGVFNDGVGNLYGYAWGENVGWISFSCEDTGICDTVSYGVRINPETGEFSGKAWGENIGWISFDSQLQVQYMIITSWKGQITISGRVSIAIAGHPDLSVQNAAVSLDGTSYATTDSNGYFAIVGVDPGTYTLMVTSQDLVSISKGITVSQGQQLLDISIPKMTVLNQGDLDQAVADAIANWDVNGDGKVGLDEAIHALQVVSGVRSE